MPRSKTSVRSFAPRRSLADRRRTHDRVKRGPEALGGRGAPDSRQSEGLGRARPAGLFHSVTSDKRPAPWASRSSTPSGAAADPIPGPLQRCRLDHFGIAAPRLHDGTGLRPLGRCRSKPSCSAATFASDWQTPSSCSTAQPRCRMPVIAARRRMPDVGREEAADGVPDRAGKRSDDERNDEQDADECSKHLLPRLF